MHRYLMCWQVSGYCLSTITGFLLGRLIDIRDQKNYSQIIENIRCLKNDYKSLMNHDYMYALFEIIQVHKNFVFYKSVSAFLFIFLTISQLPFLQAAYSIIEILMENGLNPSYLSYLPKSLFIKTVKCKTRCFLSYHHRNSAKYF